MAARLLVGWPGGSLDSAIKLGGALIAAYAIVLWISAVVWVYRDVRTRTNDPVSQAVAVILVSLFNLPGLIVYLVIRPQETIADAYERSLEAEAILHELQLDSNSCQTCRRPIEQDYAICPHCKTVLREPCRNCARSVRTNWSACPYCAADRAPARAPAPLARQAPPVNVLQAPPRRAGTEAPAAGGPQAQTQPFQASAQPQTQPRPPVTP